MQYQSNTFPGPMQMLAFIGIVKGPFALLPQRERGRFLSSAKYFNSYFKRQSTS